MTVCRHLSARDGDCPDCGMRGFAMPYPPDDWAVLDLTAVDPWPPLSDYEEAEARNEAIDILNAFFRGRQP